MYVVNTTESFLVGLSFQETVDVSFIILPSTVPPEATIFPLTSRCTEEIPITLVYFPNVLFVPLNPQTVPPVIPFRGTAISTQGRLLPIDQLIVVLLDPPGLSEPS